MCQWVKVLAQEIWGYELGFHHSGKKLGMAEQSCILSIGWQKQADSMRSKNSQSFWLKRQATGPVRDLSAIRWHDIKGDNQCLALAFCIHVHILLCMNPPLSHTHTKRGFYISLLDILAKTFIFRITWLLYTARDPVSTMKHPISHCSEAHACSLFHQKRACVHALYSLSWSCIHKHSICNTITAPFLYQERGHNLFSIIPANYYWAF